MNYKLKILLSFCILIPAVIGLIRFRNIDSAYRPFIYCIWIGLTNEVISYILVKGRHSNVINNNIYGLIEFLLFTYQFKLWGLFRKRNILFTCIISALCLAWIFENFIISQITQFE